MARFQVGIILLVLLFAVGGAAGCAMERVQGPIAQALDQAEELALAGDRAGAESAIAAARKWWRESRKFCSALADHQPLEDIECLFAQLNSGMEDADCASVCADLSRRVRAVAEAHSVTLGTLF